MSSQTTNDDDTNDDEVPYDLSDAIVVANRCYQPRIAATLRQQRKEIEQLQAVEGSNGDGADWAALVSPGEGENVTVPRSLLRRWAKAHARLLKIEEAAELVCGNEMCGIVEDAAWAALRQALGMEVCPT